jgi:hypothetical protein
MPLILHIYTVVTALYIESVVVMAPVQLRELLILVVAQQLTRSTQLVRTTHAQLTSCCMHTQCVLQDVLQEDFFRVLFKTPIPPAPLPPATSSPRYPPRSPAAVKKRTPSPKLRPAASSSSSSSSSAASTAAAAVDPRMVFLCLSPGAYEAACVALYRFQPAALPGFARYVARHQRRGTAAVTAAALAAAASAAAAVKLAPTATAATVTAGVNSAEGQLVPAAPAAESGSSGLNGATAAAASSAAESGRATIAADAANDWSVVGGAVAEQAAAAAEARMAARVEVRTALLNTLMMYEFCM